MNLKDMIKDYIKGFPEGMKKTWEAFKYFFVKDWKFALPICLIIGVGIWLTIREINYDKWYGEENVEQEIISDTTNIVKVDSLLVE